MLERLLTPAAFLDELVTLLERQGVRDDARATCAMVAVAQARGMDPKEMAAAVPSTFLATNRMTRGRLGQMLKPALVGIALRGSPELLIPMSEIDSFAGAKVVPGTALADISFPLNLLEDDVECALLKIAGEPFQQQDWGGELGDVYSPRIRLGGREIQAAMLLKGRGLGRPTMRVTDLGKNGDQIVRLAKLPATLYVVQYVGEIDEAVRTHLRQAIAYLRLTGSRDAVGSVWDGADTARLLLAHSLLDPNTGQIVAQT